MSGREEEEEEEEEPIRLYYLQNSIVILNISPVVLHFLIFVLFIHVTPEHGSQTARAGRHTPWCGIGWGERLHRYFYMGQNIQHGLGY